MSEEIVYECPRCQIGYCKAQPVTYTRIHNGHAISVPAMARYVCDICGYKEFDPEALDRLFHMLGDMLPRQPEGGLRRPHTPTVDTPTVGRKPRKNLNTP